MAFAPNATVESPRSSLSSMPSVSRVGEKQTMRRVAVGVYVALVFLGLGTGYLLSRNTKLASKEATEAPKMVKTDKIEGIADTKNFKDSAEGTLEKGGMNGEGTHKLVREGGPSQTAYLVSSVIDMDSYAGKKVKVWGETFAAKKAAWLMDVGKIEILE
ncbi:MAG: hypothetical protein AAB557_00685 [Patescibacteria group bacterium]